MSSASHKNKKKSMPPKRSASFHSESDHVLRNQTRKDKHNRKIKEDVAVDEEEAEDIPTSAKPVSSPFRAILNSVPTPSPPDRDGLEGWIRLFASIFIWFGMWGVLDVFVSKIVSRRIILCIVLGMFIVIGMILILMTQSNEEP